MSDYNPDKWVMLKFTHPNKIIYKILASWYGGYTQGNSWQLNSGITRIEEDGDVYLFHGASGSVYHCHKKTYGMHAYSMGILSNFQKDIENSNVTLDLMPEDTDFMKLSY